MTIRKRAPAPGRMKEGRTFFIFLFFNNFFMLNIFWSTHEHLVTLFFIFCSSSSNFSTSSYFSSGVAHLFHQRAGSLAQRTRGPRIHLSLSLSLLPCPLLLIYLLRPPSAHLLAGPLTTTTFRCFNSSSSSSIQLCHPSVSVKASTWNRILLRWRKKKLRRTAQRWQLSTPTSSSSSYSSSPPPSSSESFSDLQPSHTPNQNPMYNGKGGGGGGGGEGRGGKFLEDHQPPPCLSSSFSLKLEIF